MHRKQLTTKNIRYDESCVLISAGEGESLQSRGMLFNLFCLLIVIIFTCAASRKT